MVHDPEADALEFQNLLPEIPATSAMYAELKAFVRERADSRLPGHRRIDPETRRGQMLESQGATFRSPFLFKRVNASMGSRRAVKLVNEIFLSFLKGPYFDYMVENFGEPAE